MVREITEKEAYAVCVPWIEEDDLYEGGELTPEYIRSYIYDSFGLDFYEDFMPLLQQLVESKEFRSLINR